MGVFLRCWVGRIGCFLEESCSGLVVFSFFLRRGGGG